MEQTFGAFIRQKRLAKMIKLHVFASQIGISNVYLSYIETGKRPAPSNPIIVKIKQELNLNENETATLYSLALLSHSKKGFPPDLLDYICSRPYIMDTLRLAVKNNADEALWSQFRKMISLKNTVQTEND